MIENDERWNGQYHEASPKNARRFAKAQAEIAMAEITGESGAGLVKVQMNGRHDVKRVSIDDSLMEEDKEILEDLITAAVNDAVRKVESHTKEKMASITGGMGMPPGFNMPF